MKKKIIGILVCALLIATALPAVGIMNISQTMKTEPSDPQPAAIQTGYLSVPAAAFTPEDQLINFFNYGSYITGDGWFYAPVNIHNEATVTKLTFYWSDFSVSDARLILIRSFNGLEDQMAEASTSGSAGGGFSEDITISNALIDNTAYSYFLALDLADMHSIYYYNAIIEYTYATGENSGGDIVENEQTQMSQGSVESR